MPVIMPDFAGRRCYYLRLCGEIETADSELPEAFRDMRKGQWPIAEYARSGVIVQMRVGLSPVENGRAHLHFDISPKSWWLRRGKTPPVSTVGEQEIAELVEALRGRVYEGEFDGFFTVPEGSLSEAFRGPTYRADLETGIQVEMSSATLAIRGGAITRFKWEKGKVRDEMRVVLTGDIGAAIGDTLFTSPLLVVETHLTAFLREGEDQ